MVLRWRSFCLVLWIGRTDSLSETHSRSHAAEHAKFENFSNVKKSVKIKMKEHWDSMIEWHNDRGTIGKNIEMRRGPYGTGLFATGLIKKHAHILKLKPDSLVTANTAIETISPMIGEIEDAVKLDCDDILSIWLVLEQRKGNSSEYHTYLQHLPHDFSRFLINWPAQYDHFLTDDMIFTKNFEQIHFMLRFKKIEHSFNLHNVEDAISEEEFKGAFLTVRSRGIEWWKPKETDAPVWFQDLSTGHTGNARMGCHALAPLFDFINHRHHPNIGWEVAGDEEALEVFALHDVHKNHELFMTYRKTLSNKDTVIKYGFSTTDKRKVKERIEFISDEVIQGCQNALALSEAECYTKIQSDHESYVSKEVVEADCKFKADDIVAMVKNSAPIKHKDEDRDRITDVLVWMMRKRLTRIKELQVHMIKHVPLLKKADKYYEKMISDLYISEQDTLERCIEKLHVPTKQKKRRSRFYDNKPKEYIGKDGKKKKGPMVKLQSDGQGKLKYVQVDRDEL